VAEKSTFWVVRGSILVIFSYCTFETMGEADRWMRLV
jgi:hypothetical protein